MSTTRRRVFAGLALLVLLVAGSWGLLGRPRGESRTPLDKLVAELRLEEPWHYRLLKRTNTLRLLPKRWLSKAYDAYMERSNRRWTAIRGLGGLGTNAWPAVPRLAEAVKHKNPEIAFLAAEALVLIKANESPEWDTCQRVLAGHSSAARAFHWLLTSPDVSGLSAGLARRRFGLIGLTATGPAAVLAHDEVVQLLKFSPEPELRAWSVMALGAMASKANTVPLVKSTLQKQEEWPAVSAAAARALAAAMPEAPETRRLLQRALQDRRSLVRLAAARALWSLKAPPEEILPVLMALLQHKLATVRAGELDGLAEMGRAARPSQSLVEALQSDENEAVRRAARATLRSITGETALGPDKAPHAAGGRAGARALFAFMSQVPSVPQPGCWPAGPPIESRRA